MHFYHTNTQTTATPTTYKIDSCILYSKYKLNKQLNQLIILHFHPYYDNFLNSCEISQT